MLPLPAHQVAGLAAVALPGTVGIGYLLAGYLGSLADSCTGFTGRDALRLESITADLVTALLAHHLDRTNPPLRSHTGTLYLRIMAFIDEHLHDPELRPATMLRGLSPTPAGRGCR